LHVEVNASNLKGELSMLSPICIAYSLNNAVSDESVKYRFKAFLKWCGLDDESKYKVHIQTSGQCGLIYLTPVINIFEIELSFCSPSRFVVSEYLPFGASRFVSKQALSNSDYLPTISQLLQKKPAAIVQFTPPFALYDLDSERESLHIFTDYRGFGRVYEFKGDFGTVWGNKIEAMPFIAATQVDIDEDAWCERCASLTFYKNATGYKNVKLLEEALTVSVDTRTGETSYSQVLKDTDYLKEAPPLVKNKVKETAQGLRHWFDDFASFYTGKIKLGISGGRDSRVLAAYAIERGLDVAYSTFFPPDRDLLVVKELNKKLNSKMDLEVYNMVDTRSERFNRSNPLLETTMKIIRAESHDACIEGVIHSNEVDLEHAPQELLLVGAQGEMVQSVYYKRAAWKKEQEWMETRHGSAPSHARILEMLYEITHGMSTSEMCSSIAMKRLYEQWIPRARNADVRGFHCIDLLYCQSTLNRFWPGAMGNYDCKTPLLEYSYVKNGFGQSIQSKLDSTFIRDVVDQAMPAWRDIPFTHEYS